MRGKIKPFIISLFLTGCTFFSNTVSASHLAGGEMTYTFLGDSAGFHRYLVTFKIYQDCMNGIPEVIAEDNPAYIAVYSANSANTLIRKDSVAYTSSVPVPQMINSSCGLVSGGYGCILMKTFIIHFALPNSTYGYNIVYDRSSRNAGISNLAHPDESGMTLTCTIPGTIQNNSAVMKNLPTLNASLNSPFSIDYSATDPDADSLSYELCPALDGASVNDVKPYPPYAPPFDSVTYLTPFSSINPISCVSPVQLDPVTGMLTGTPIQAGRYLIAVCCHEWRGGVMINTIRRESELTVLSVPTSDYKPYAGGDLTLIVGEHYQFNATGANTYTWTPSTYLDNPNIPNPIGIFPDAGKFTYKLHGVTDSGCSGDDVITVTVLASSYFAVPNAFTPNDDGYNDFLYPIPIGNSILTDFRIFNRWGNLVFKADDLASAGWDGKYKGKHQDMGLYYWELKFTDNGGKSQLIKGNVALIR